MIIDPFRSSYNGNDMAAWSQAQAAWLLAVVTVLALLASLIAIAVAYMGPRLQAEQEQRRAADVFAIVTLAVAERFDSLYRWELAGKRNLALNSKQLDLGELRTLLLRLPFEKLSTKASIDFLKLVAICGTGASVWWDETISSEQKVRELEAMAKQARELQAGLASASER